jgi:hypothetical protein
MKYGNLMDSKGYHDQKASYDEKKAGSPKIRLLKKKSTFPHFFSPVFLSNSRTLQILQNKRKN